jgi:nitronate monooxygenase
MSKLPAPLDRLPFPVIGSPLFIISTPKLVIAQCIAGVVGSMPALNARPAEQLEEWLIQITEALAAYNRANPDKPAAPFAINQIVHKSNDRLEHDMAMCVKYKVPIIITSLGAREEINAAAHSCGGVKSPFALIQKIRQWFDGPLALSGAISTGGAVLAAQAMGADFAYIGSDEIVDSNLFTGVHGNCLAPSIRASGLDPQNLPESDPSKMNFGGASAKAWKEIWGCGQGIGAVTQIQSTANYVAQLKVEYAQARERLAL